MQPLITYVYIFVKTTSFSPLSMVLFEPSKHLMQYNKYSFIVVK